MAEETVPPIRSSKACPFCGEQILPEAKKCKHCGETVDIALRAAEEAKRANDKPMVFMNAGGGGGGGGGGVAVQQKQNFPHVLHGIITLCTCGSWAIVWILLYIFRNKDRYW
ncbi:MAG: hypothetical protein WCH84_07770 [Verrucomicrobiota bacterium]